MCSTEWCLHTTSESARLHAQIAAVRLRVDQASRWQRVGTEELARFNRATEFESVAHGPLSRQGMMALALGTPDDPTQKQIVDFQTNLAYKVLLAATHGLRGLPSDVRRRIYAYAFTSRALPEAWPASPTDMFQVKIEAGGGHPDQPWSGLYALWPQSLPRAATINDAKRCVHARLWEVNATRPRDERLSDKEMLHLNIEWGVSWELEGNQHAPRPSVYTGGARPFHLLVEQLRQQGNELMFSAFV
jgi:hypothetical protein